MSFGDGIRRLIDPLDPHVATWLRRELPRLVEAGLLDTAQADAIAQRYGVAPVAPYAPAAPEASAPQTEVPPFSAEPGAVPAGSGADVPLTSGGPPTMTTPGVAGGPPATTTQGVPGGPPVQPAALAQQQRAASPFFAEQAVSIVLYLGAFLVVTAVAIFLAYSWGDISGPTKLGLLMAFTAGFLGAAALCLRFPAVRPAGRTFLAIGAVLVPANVAAAYLLVFSDSRIPGAVFWLLGALLSGGLHALLSLRLGSRAYGVLAMLAVPVAADALFWLFVPEAGWLGPPAALALVATLAVARPYTGIPLAQAAHVVGAGLLPLAALVALPAVGDADWTSLAAPIALVLSSSGLAWEATRRGFTWWFGAAANLLLVPFVALALANVGDRPLFVAAVIASAWVGSLAARRLDRQRAVLWDASAILPALIYPIAAWESDWQSATLMVSAALLSVFQTYAWRSPLPLYAAVLAVDGLFVKILAIYGSPDSPAWRLGVALWPLGIIWSALACTLARRLVGPFLMGAGLTLVASAILVGGQHGWEATVSLSAAAATIAIAWRLRIGLILLAAVPWLLLGIYEVGTLLEVDLPFRLAATGLAGWLLLAISTLRPPALPATSRPAPPAPPAATPPETPAPATPSEPPIPASASAAQLAATSAPPTSSPVQPAGAPASPDAPDVRRSGALGQQSLNLEWGLSGRLAAVIAVGLSALLVSAWLLDASRSRRDAGLEATTLAWLNLTLTLGGWAWLTRSRDVTLVAALSLVPALVTGVARLHLDEPQAYALSIGLYLLVIAAVQRRDRRPERQAVANGIATLGLLVLLGIGVVQSLDEDRFRYAAWTLLESIVVLGVGIGVRWRALAVGGVTGTVAIALRQLFDAISALPGWAILGGTGLLLLGGAVVLLLARARLAAAGRAAAERWSSWD